MELKQSVGIEKIPTDAPKGLLQELDRFLEDKQELNLFNLSEVETLKKMLTEMGRG